MTPARTWAVWSPNPDPAAATALPRRVPNDAAGIARLVAVLTTLAPTLVVLEAIGSPS